jgi:hypothetical protein
LEPVYTKKENQNTFLVCVVVVLAGEVLLQSEKCRILGVCSAVLVAAGKKKKSQREGSMGEKAGAERKEIECNVQKLVVLQNRQLHSDLAVAERVGLVEGLAAVAGMAVSERRKSYGSTWRRRDERRHMIYYNDIE